MLLVIFVWAAPVLALVVLRDHPARVEGSVLEPASPSLAPVGERMLTHRRETTLRIETAPTTDLAVARAGIVTALDIEEGASLADGLEVLRVDDRPILALVGGMPLYRELRLGDEGPDVERLHQLLDARGIEVTGDPSRFTSSTRRGVVDLQESLGLAADGVIQPHDFAYLPGDVGQVDEIHVSVGTRVREDSVVASMSNPPRSARLTIHGGIAGPLEDEAVRVTVGEHGVRLDRLVPADEELQALAQMVEEASAELTAVRSDRSLEVTGLFVERAEPLRVGTVPAAAIHTDPTGSSCVFVAGRDDPDGSGEPHLVPSDFPPSGEIGVAIVPHELFGRTVELRAQPTERMCTSR